MYISQRLIKCVFSQPPCSDIVTKKKLTFTEICYRREFGPEWPSSVETVVQTLDGVSGVLLVLEPSVNVANKVIANIIADMHFFNLAIFRQLDKEILVDVVKVLLDLGFCQRAVGVVRRVVVNVGDKDGLREIGLDVFPGAPVAVSACSDFEVERTVHPEIKGTKKQTS